MKRTYWVIHRVLRNLGIALLTVATLTTVIVLNSGAPVKWDISVQEDDPGWNCQTMGNRTCGVKGL